MHRSFANHLTTSAVRHSACNVAKLMLMMESYSDNTSVARSVVCQAAVKRTPAAMQIVLLRLSPFWAYSRKLLEPAETPRLSSLASALRRRNAGVYARPRFRSILRERELRVIEVLARLIPYY